jgi:hypothetical protein
MGTWLKDMKASTRSTGEQNIYQQLEKSLLRACVRTAQAAIKQVSCVVPDTGGEGEEVRGDRDTIERCRGGFDLGR